MAIYSTTFNTQKFLVFHFPLGIFHNPNIDQHSALSRIQYAKKGIKYQKSKKKNIELQVLLRLCLILFHKNSKGPVFIPGSWLLFSRANDGYILTIEFW